MFFCRIPCWDEARFSLVFVDVTMQSSLLIWGTVQFCLFRCNNAEFSVQMGNGSVCWDGERFSLTFCNVNRFSAFCCATRLEWNSVFLVVKYTDSALSVTQRGWNGIRVCVCDFESITKVRLAWLRWGTVQSVGMWNAFCDMNQFSVT